MVEIVRQAVRRGQYELSIVAKDLSMQERSVQRRLKAEGTTFHTVLDAERREMAETFLQVPTLTVEEIANKLGFSGEGGFRRAFRRWTGRSPRGSD